MIEQQSSTYHTSCDTLIYSTFLKIITTGDVELLLITGRADKAQLLAAWEHILNEYSELVQNEKSSSMFLVWKKIVYTKWQISFLAEALDYLKNDYDHHVAMSIAELGYDMIEEKDDRQQYLKQIYRVETEAKSLVVLLNQYNNEYQRLCPTAQGPVERTMADYDKELAILGKYMGHRIDKNVYTVSEVAAIINLYLEEIKHQKKAA